MACLVEKSLNGKTIDQALTYKTHDCIEIKPLYTQDDVTSEAGSAFLKATNKQERQVADTDPSSHVRPWQILQLTDIPSLKSANKQIKIDLDGGASGLFLAISNDIPFASAELPIYSGKDYETLFDGVDLTGKSIYFTNGSESIVNAANFISYLQTQGIDLAQIEGSFGFDPLSIFACMGSFPEPEDEALESLRRPGAPACS